MSYGKVVDAVLRIAALEERLLTKGQEDTATEATYL
jgi:hypothetical protein